MKAKSLWEPWGSAILHGLKKWETRPQRTHYRGPLAIHCAKTRDEILELRCLPMGPYFKKAEIFLPSQLHFGKIVCIADLTDCLPTDNALALGLISEQEAAFGNYASGRFAWKLENVRPIIPVEWKGSQGWFEVPDSILIPATP